MKAAMRETPSSGRLHFNGIDGTTGDYLFPPVLPEDLYPVIRGRELDPIPAERGLLDESRRWSELYGDGEYLGVRDGIDPNALGETGWGVVLPAVPPQDAEKSRAQKAILDALAPLLEHRRSQAGERFKVFEGAAGYYPEDSARKWLARQGAPADLPVDPRRGVPYYLLLVGSPEEVPFEFQYELDVEYAVGRIHFDTLEEYARYARGVVEAERGPVLLPRQAAVFGVENPGDPSTELSSKGLVQPLLAELVSEPLREGGERTSSPWTVEPFLGVDATKATLAQLLGGSRTPALLFTASHGMGFSNMDDPWFEPHTGALLCQDWPGPGARPLPEHYFAAEDVGSEARLLGMVAFFFACYGAGIPSLQDFPTDPHQDQGAPERIAHHAFISRLPRRLLAHERGGALAVIGHVERAWGSSFWTPSLGQGADLFADSLRRLMRGGTVGHAMDLFNNRFSRKAIELTQILSTTRWGGPPKRGGAPLSKGEIVESWIEAHDARNYVILGDPAVRLRVSATPPAPVSPSRP